LLKPGGRLVYATCSLLAAENEEIAQAFTAAQTDAFKPLEIAGLLERAHVGESPSLVEGEFMRLWTHRHGMDGFFAAAWERT
jgi:16S rRNA (cytosine967-C5)-methyltransferase